MNKKIIKKVFNENINKDKIYESVMNRVNKKRFDYLKLSIIPVCIVVLICFIGFRSDNQQLIKSNSDIIYINNIDSINDSLYDIAWNGVSITKEQLSLKFNWINKLDNNNLYYSNYIDLSDNNIDTYLMLFSYSDINLEIFISEVGEKKPRCVSFLDEKNIKESIISGVTTKIYKAGNTYIAFFNIDGFNYDIEINNISEEDFIKLIKLILE